MGIWDDIRRNFREGNALIRLIYINVAVFLALTLAAVAGFLFRNEALAGMLTNFLAVPASPGSLLLRPWTVFTYMFVHKDIWHILFNMLWLYWFGKIFLEFLDQRKLVAVYILGGLSGSVLYILSFNFFPVFDSVVGESVAIGASASVMAIVVAAAAYVPDYPVHLLLLGRVRIKYVALAIFILTSFMDFSVNSGGKIAHIGGAVFGYFYTLNLRRGRDAGKYLNSILDSVVTLFRPRRKMKVTYRKKADDIEYNMRKAEHQARINAILDKISKGGYESLTKEEKDTLFRESQKK
ncbi:MAG: rhomboid family intramembrane serine protease [Bacteroidales bacterium]|jgi:membrane associated rhomboid family serine protease|nr:rhomboid family intramembrane serine protease [Bacteroidales bacterium]